VLSKIDTLTILLTSSFYPPYHLGGDAVHVKYLAEALAKRGHEVHILYSLDAYEVKTKKRPELKKDNDLICHHPIETFKSHSAYSAYFLGNSDTILRKFRALTKEIKPNVVHHHNVSLLGYGIIEKNGNYKNLYTAHDYWLVCQKSSLLKKSSICVKKTCAHCSLMNGRVPQIWRRQEAFKRAISSVDLLIAPCNFMKDALLSRSLSVPIKVLPNFVPLPPSKIAPSGFSNFFLYSGVLERHKGILDLINLYANNKSLPTLLITGKGSLSNEITCLLRENNLQDRVKLLGWIDNNQLFQLLNDANALIMPSLWPENSPLIAIEALSVGTPVISSNMGGLPEIVGKVDNSLIYNNSQELLKLLGGYSKKIPKSQVKEAYFQNFSSDIYVKKYESFLETIH
jgi:glycosyltransferase involved in cell wall biosynthesis